MSMMGGGLRSKLVTDAVARLGPTAVRDILGVRMGLVMDLFAGRIQPTAEQEELLRKSDQNDAGVAQQQSAGLPNRM